MINIQCFEEYGAPVAGRGTSIDLGDVIAHPELGNWNLKMSPDPLVPYYPTANSSGYAMQRPTLPGGLVFSYKKYIYFNVSGTYASKLKDLRLFLKVPTPEAPEAPEEPNPQDYDAASGGFGGTGSQFNADYEAWIDANAKYLKDKEAYDQAEANKGAQAQKYNLFYKMSNVYAAPDNNFDGKMICAGPTPSLTLYPKVGTTPLNANTRSIVYGPNQSFCTNYIVVQMAATASTWNDVGNTAELQLRLSFKEFL